MASFLMGDVGAEEAVALEGDTRVWMGARSVWRIRLWYRKASGLTMFNLKGNQVESIPSGQYLRQVFLDRYLSTTF